MLLILEEHDMENYAKGEVTELEGDEDKAKHKKNLVKAKRIIVESIKDHLIPHVSSLKTHKEMFDALNSLCEEKNVLVPGNSQVATVRDSPQSTFPTSPLTIWYRESVRFCGPTTVGQTTNKGFTGCGPVH